MIGLHDLRHAIRGLRNSPGFAAVAIATLALAIGANTAMFSVVNGLFLRPLPYPESDRIVRVLERLPNGGPNSVSTLNYLDWSSQNTVFEYMAAEAGWRPTLTGGDEAISIRGARVSARYFDIFGVRPALGRPFLPEEDHPGRQHVVLLSHVLWENRFGADPALVGQDISLDGQPYTVIGILPEGGPFDRAAAQIWAPLAFEPARLTRDFRWLGASAKLKPGVTLQRARAEMNLVGQRLASAYPDSNTGWGIAVDRLEDVLISPALNAAVSVLFAATAFVLLIGCANLANLALARSSSQGPETAVRAALGAGRWRLIQRLLIEHVVIAVCGGAAGVAVSFVLMQWIRSLIPGHALPPAVHLDMDGSVLLFTLVVAVATGLLFGMAPAAETTNPNLISALKEGGRGSTTGRRLRRVQTVLVVGEVALAFVLLAASGLLMRSLINLLEVDPGFDAANVLTAGLPVTQAQHPDPAELNTYLASIRAAVEAVPGVREAAMTSVLPLEGWGYGMPYAIAGRTATDRANRRRAFFKIVSPSYFHVLGIKLVAGRALDDNDTPGTPRVALINEAMASREFPDESPIGRRVLTPELVPGGTELGQEIAWEIVGVIASERITGLGDATSAGMYVSIQQSPTYAISLVVRTDVPPQSLQGVVRSAVDDVSRDQALSDVRTMEQIVEQSTLGNRVVGRIFSLFAGIALLLSAIGLYGVVSYTTGERMHEMGIRSALGASARHLRRLVFMGGIWRALIGLAIGLAATLATTGLLSSMLYGIDARDPLTIAGAAAVLLAVAGLACFLPARSITKVDPIEVLRSQ